ncbi:hypothetical protein GIB67_021529 [Kingdonia uniflora]|uniref:Uncharacterized protein n=1 Tax=Kingdonia uniflora TaxID=39325 RepID=A0A7J7L9T1_9MAGN|nr:hypothetical protein GIB67_021529 [Kingdonia uniflora]
MIEEKKKGKEERQKKTNANKKNLKTEEVDVPLKKKVKGTKIEDLTDEQLDHQGSPREGLDMVKDLMVDDDVEVGREINLEAISSEYGGDFLEYVKWKKGKIDGEEKAEDDKEQPQVVDDEEVQEMEDSEHKTVVVYYDGKKDVVEEANERTGISFDDCDARHVNYPHHDALVVMLKMRNMMFYTMMIDIDNTIELLFQSTIDQMGLADKVQPSDIDICGFNGSKEERVGNIILPITAGPLILDVVFYVINTKSCYLGKMGHCWLHNMRDILSTYSLALHFEWEGRIHEIKGSQKLARACKNSVVIGPEPSEHQLS